MIVRFHVCRLLLKVLLLSQILQMACTSCVHGKTTLQVKVEVWDLLVCETDSDGMEEVLAMKLTHGTHNPICRYCTCRHASTVSYESKYVHPKGLFLSASSKFEAVQGSELIYATGLIWQLP